MVCVQGAYAKSGKLGQLLYFFHISGEGLERIASQLTPDEFSDTTTDDNVDLSKMTEEEREAYLRNREKRRAAREKRRREKYGDKYDEIMKKREQ